MTDPRRRIPGTDALLAEPRLTQAVEQLGQQRVKQAIQQAQQRARQQHIPPLSFSWLLIKGAPGRQVRHD